jgi:hypothetical protein
VEARESVQWSQAEKENVKVSFVLTSLLLWCYMCKLKYIIDLDFGLLGHIIPICLM